MAYEGATAAEAVARAVRPVKLEEFKRDTSITDWILAAKAEAQGRQWIEMKAPIEKALGTQRIQLLTAWSEDGKLPANLSDLERLMRKAFGAGDGAEFEVRFDQARRGQQTYTEYVSRLINLARRTGWAEESMGVRRIRMKLPKDIQEKIIRCTRYLDILPIVQEYDSIYSDKPEHQVQAVQRGDGGRGSKCHRCGQTGHIAKWCRAVATAEVTAGAGPSTLKCYRCGGIGHFSRDCKQTEAVCYTCQRPGHMANQCPTRGPQTAKPVEQAQANLGTCLVCRSKEHIMADCRIMKRFNKNMEKANKSQVLQVSQPADFPLGQADQTNQ